MTKALTAVLSFRTVVSSVHASRRSFAVMPAALQAASALAATLRPRSLAKNGLLGMPGRIVAGSVNNDAFGCTRQLSA